MGQWVAVLKVDGYEASKTPSINTGRRLMTTNSKKA